ncbi:hypothetical protein FB462_2068 [Curtobacterium citreum]|nr:hypothetical protein FB462_2068 [Curtobacterium citreum]
MRLRRPSSGVALVHFRQMIPRLSSNPAYRVCMSSERDDLNAELRPFDLDEFLHDFVDGLEPVTEHPVSRGPHRDSR